MVLKPEPIAECVEWLEREHGTFEKFVLCPSGIPFRQPVAESLASRPRILMLCGRYEGYDARVVTRLGFTPLSVGDYVLAGGELGALCVTEAVTRLLPGVLGDERSALEDSFGSSGGFDHPHFTRPRVFRGEAVPDVLLSGDHAAIARWRAQEAERRTRAQRPELLGARPTEAAAPAEPSARNARRDASAPREAATPHRESPPDRARPGENAPPPRPGTRGRDHAGP